MILVSLIWSPTAIGDTIRVRKLPVNYYEQRALDRLDRERADAQAATNAARIQRTVPGETIKEREEREAADRQHKQRRAELLKSFRSDADSIQADALKRLEKEPKANMAWIKAKAYGQKPLAPIAAKDAVRLLNLDEVKAWINSEAQYAKIEKRLK